jgi:hypothetical protein
MTLARHQAGQATGTPAAGGLPSVEEVLAELDQMYQTLLAKDEDLKLAGQIGVYLRLHYLYLRALRRIALVCPQHAVR